MTVTDIKRIEKVEVTFDTVNAKRLIGCIKSAAKAASTDAGRPVLCHVNVEVRDNMLRFTGTNSYMGVRTEMLVIDNTLPDFKAAFDAKQLVAALPKVKAGTQVKFMLTPGEREFDPGILTIGDVNGALTLLHGTADNFPNIASLHDGAIAEIEQAGPGAQKIAINPKLMLQVMQSANLMAIEPDVPVVMQNNITEMKPMLLTRTPMVGVTWSCILMPVRIP